MKRTSTAIATMVLFVRLAGADGPTVLDQAGSGIVRVNDERLVRVHGIEGQIILEAGAAGNLEFSSTSIAKPEEELPLALTTDGAAFGLEPAKGVAIVKTRLRIVVPVAMRVLLEVGNVSIHAARMESELTVQGSQIRLEAVGLMRRTKLEIDGGSVTVQGAGEGLTLKARDVEAGLDGISGAVSLNMTGGSARLTGLQGGLQGEFVRTRVGVNSTSGGVDLRFQGGKAQLTALRDGGQISATGVPLVLSQIGGDLRVTSDSDVQFGDSRASIHIDNTAGGVNGSRNDGIVEITTHKASVSLTQINGQLRVAGDELEVRLQDIGGTTAIRTSASNVSIEGIAAVSVENDRGEVTIKRSEAQIEVKSHGGDVHLLDMRGPVNVEAAGDLVEVEFSSVPGDRDSHIVNDGGEVTVRILGGNARVDAVSKFGRVDSNLANVPPGRDETSAQGATGAGTLRGVFVKASGDVHLIGPGSAEPSGQNP